MVKEDEGLDESSSGSVPILGKSVTLPKYRHRLDLHVQHTLRNEHNLFPDSLVEQANVLFGNPDLLEPEGKVKKTPSKTSTKSPR